MKRKKNRKLFWGIALLVSMVIGVIFADSLQPIRAMEETNTSESEVLNTNDSVGNVYGVAGVIDNQLNAISDKMAELEDREELNESSEANESGKEATENAEMDLKEPVEAKEVPVAKAANAQTRAAVDVSTWAGLSTALSNATVTTEINVVTDLVATSTITNTVADASINFNGHTVSFGNYSIKVPAATTVRINDLVYTGTGTTVARAAFLGDGDVIFTGNVTSAVGNVSALANMVNGTRAAGGITFDGAVVKIDSTRASLYLMSSKNLTMTNATQFTTPKTTVFDVALAGGETIIEKQTQIFNHTGVQENNIPWNFKEQTTVTIKDEGTLMDISGFNTGRVNDGGLFNVTANLSTINIIDKATVNIHALGQVGLQLMSAGGALNVRNNSVLNVTSDTDNGYALGSAIRFREVGDMTFNVESQSKITVEKKTGRTPAIRMFGGGNVINVSGSSDFTVHNVGDGTPRNPGADSRNQGIQFTGGSTSSPANEFHVIDEDSNVSIVADSGAALDGSTRKFEITAGEGTYFVAEGKTAAANYGIFNGGIVTFEMTNVKYFDFRNNRDGGGYVFDTGAGSKFSSTGSQLSVWKAGANLDNTPSNAWKMFDYSLSGANYPTIDSSTDADFIKNYLGAPAYSRMSANNQTAIVESIRIPTNADKYIYAKVVVPEEKGSTPRPAWNDEIDVQLKVTKSDGTEYTKYALTVGDEQTIYNDATPSKGFVKIAVPNGDFIETGDTVSVVAAWRGTHQDGNLPSKPEDLIATPQKTLDVTPPTPAPTSLTSGVITNATKQLSAKDLEPNARVQLSVNDGTPVEAGTVAADGTWNYDLTGYLEHGDKVTIYLTDVTPVFPAEFDPRGLEGTRIDTGNRNPKVETAYHDTTFAKATEFIVVDVLPDAATIEKTVAVEGGATTTQVGDWLIYTLKVKNTKDASIDTVWKDVKIEDVLDANLKFDAANTGITPSDATFDYDETSRKLTLNLGDLASQEEKTVTFKAQVQRSAVGNTILNSAKAIGYTPREAGTFVPGIVDNPTYQTYEVVTTKPIENPGGAVFGTLSLISAPDVIDFDIQSVNEKATHVTNPTYSNPLVVEDTRASDRQDPWHITVKLIQELTLLDEQGDPGTDILRDAIRFVYGDKTTTLTNQATPLVGNDYAAPDANGLYTLSEGWKDTATTDGFELYVPAGKVESLGNYQAVLEWNIENTPLPAAANNLPRE